LTGTAPTSARWRLWYWWWRYDLQKRWCFIVQVQVQVMSVNSLYRSAGEKRIVLVGQWTSAFENLLKLC